MFWVNDENIHLLIGGIPQGINVPSEVSRVNYQGPMDGVKIDLVPVGLWDTEVSKQFAIVLNISIKTRL